MWQILTRILLMGLQGLPVRFTVLRFHRKARFPHLGDPLCIYVAATTVTAVSTVLVVMGQEDRPRICTLRAPAPRR